jgi:hypothetical protein
VAGAQLVMDGTLTDQRLRQHLAHLQSVSLLHFDNLEPHTFAGFENAQVRYSLGWLAGVCIEHPVQISIALPVLYCTFFELWYAWHAACIACTAQSGVMVQDNVEFEQFHSRMRWEQKWCCMTANYTHREAGHHHIFYVQPTQLTQNVQLPWDIPHYKRPEACNLDHVMPLQRQDEPVLKSLFDSPEHPCNYFKPGHEPLLPAHWTRNVSDLHVPVQQGHGWAPFKVAGDKVDGSNMHISMTGMGAA